jgi:hypothetical protein
MQADKKLVKTYKIHAEEIFTACKNGSKALLRAQDSQWFPNFHNAIKASAISDANWIFQLTQAWKKLGVECLPGIDNHGCTTSKQMLQLTDISTRIAPESSQSNAMKQRAIEEAGPVKIEQRQKMDLGKLSEIDPQLFVEISKQQAASGLQSDSISHYEMMKDVLRENANDPKLHCCLILAKILGAASKSVTPTVKKNWTGSDGRQGKVEGTGYGLTPVVHLKVDRKNSSQDFYRVNTVLRFLWMAYPDSFSPLKIQEHSAMGITKMRQKIGHKGALPVVLAEVGLAIVRARWPKPRPEEVALHSDDALKQLRDQLWSLRKSPRELIEVVFGLDSDDQWLNRCAALLVDA